MKMRDLLSIPRVIPRLRARDKQDALRKLAARAAGDAGVPVAAIVHSLLECAELPAFGLGPGVSLAHTFVPGLGGPIATFARLEPALDFGASDGSKTDLLALLLSPTESASHHLRALACMRELYGIPTCAVFCAHREAAIPCTSFCAEMTSSIGHASPGQPKAA